MAITIKEIAVLAGVSVGTVDRALHGRGRIKLETEERVKQIAQENGFRPSRMARALALSKNPIKIGVVIHLTKTEFMKQVLDGVRRAKKELEGLGAEITVKEIPGLSHEAQLDAVDELVRSGVQGIALSPVDDPSIRKRINELSALGISVVTLNTDIAGSDRMCFVGLDNFQSGRIAAGLMGISIGGVGKVLVITGHLTNQANHRRVAGFMHELEESFPKIQLMEVQVCFDDDLIAKDITTKMMCQTPELRGIFLIAAGQAGVCAGLEGLSQSSKVRVLAYDVILSTVEGLKSGVIDFAIDQNTFLQGYKPVILLYDKLFSGKTPPTDVLYIDSIIRTKQNISND